MSEETEPILDDKKLLEKITNMEQLSQEILSIQREQKNNIEILQKNKDFINYLFEHQNVKDLDFYILYPNMMINSDNKNGIFHEIKRKDCVPYIQNIISNCSKNKISLEKKLDDVKNKLINIIKDPSELDILDNEIYQLLIPLAYKKFPKFFGGKENLDIIEELDE